MSKLKEKSVLILSPHPDDMEISVGILSLIAVSKGYKVSQIIITDGRFGGIDVSLLGKDELIEKRKKEALKGASILGIKETIFLDFEDGKLLENIDAVYKVVYDEIIKHSPNVIVYPSEIDLHPDHKALGEICNLIVNKMSKLIALKYCFWGEGSFNCIISAPEYSEKRMEAIRAHISQPIDTYLKMLNTRGEFTEDRFDIYANISKAVKLFYPYIKII